MASTSTLNEIGPPSPEGAIASATLTRCLSISSPLRSKTASTGSSVSTIPIFEYCPEIVTISPGSGSVGVKPIPLPSASGATSEFASLIKASPTSMSRYPSPSMSAIAGAAHVLCGKSIGAAHPVPISAEVPVFPSKANTLLPNATNNSGSSSPSKSIEIGGDTAISSLSVPPPLCKVLDHSLNGGSIVMS